MPKKKKQSETPVKKRWYRIYWDKLLFLFFVALFVLLTPGQNVYTSGLSREKSALRDLALPVPTPAPYPINLTGIYPGGDITATGLVVLDVNSGVFLYKRNEEELLAPASTTKILTALVALDMYDLDDIVTVKSIMNSGQVMGLAAGERITVENLLFGALIQSGNDAAYALAEHHPGGVDGFIAAMNEKAKALHLTKSTFTNPVGFDDPAHKMTPMDLARLGSIALENKVIAKMVAIPQITVSDVTHTYFHPLKNVNELLGKIPGVGGIKTGWTEEAGENLITLVDRNDHRLIIVVLRSQDRFGETSKIIDWIFTNYQWEVIAPPTPSIQR
jgi:serine-type D-Ala-D-Ala carboxypeptidase (penicillin-binding protein 5/6)